MRKILLICAAPALLLLALAGCVTKDPLADSVGGAVAVQATEIGDYFSEEDLDAGYDEAAATRIQLAGDDVTISQAGDYILSGALADGQVKVEVSGGGTVRLVLDGAEISCSDSAALYVAQAEKTVVTLAAGSENTLSDGGGYTLDGTEQAACLYSKDDLVINGSGSLTVNGNYRDGVNCRDELKIAGGHIRVTAADDGIVGKDLLAVANAALTVVAGGDGLKASNDSDQDSGVLFAGSGTFDITSGNDGLQAVSLLTVLDGEFSIVTKGGAGQAPEHQAENFQPGGGFPGGLSSGFPTQGEDSVSGDSVNSAEQSPAPERAAAAQQNAGAEQQAGEAGAAAEEEESESAKAIKADGDLLISGGTFTVDSYDDCLHANGNIVIRGGAFQLASGDDGLHADSSVTISDGRFVISQSYEGIEGLNITISGGDFDIMASDDGINVAGGNDLSQAGGRFGPDQFNSGNAAAGSYTLAVSGGNLLIDAGGDGLDSNGSISQSGGSILINGPADSGNGALDYQGSYTMTGGSLFAVGPAMMAAIPGSESAVYLVSAYLGDQEAGSAISLRNTAGEELAGFIAAKPFSHAVIASPQLRQDEAYSLYVNDVLIEAFTVSQTITAIGEDATMNAGQPGGRSGGRQGGMGMQPPGDAAAPVAPNATEPEQSDSAARISVGR